MDKELIKHSIFKQDTKALRYYLSNHGFTYTPTGSFYNTVYHSGNIKKIKDEEIIESKIICTLDIEMPLLEIGEKFYIEDQDLKVVIKDRTRTSNGNVLYQVDDKVVTDEETENTLKHCEDILINIESYKQQFEAFSLKIRKLNELIKIMENQKEKEKSKEITDCKNKRRFTFFGTK